MNSYKKDLENYILGIDVGIASVGAAVLGEDKILGLHVRTFDRAETAKEGESLNKIRREARLIRRRLRRRVHRLKRLRQLFESNGITTNADPGGFDTSKSPWVLRAEGLDRLLLPQEWAASLYHIVKHRGFQSNRKSEAKEDEKAGQMLNAITQNQTLLAESGLRTVGELAAKHDFFALAKRNKAGAYTQTFSRVDHSNELHLLFSRQRELGNQFAKLEFEEAVHELLMARRPALSGEGLLKMLGKCTFEPDEFRAPKASYSVERFIWLTKLNNLRINNLGEIRALSDKEREVIANFPFQKTKITYKQVRKELDIADTARFIGLRYPSTNDGSKDPELSTLFEAKAFHSLRKLYDGAGLKSEWARDSQNPEKLNDLAYALTVFKEDNESRLWLNNQNIEDSIIEATLDISFSSFVRLSIKAIKRILPYMEQGMRYDEAVQAAGYVHHSNIHKQNKKKYIPRFSRDSIPNPVVARALNQARKLVNSIAREYGPPKAVHIELARDLSKSFDERNKIRKEQENYQKVKSDDIKQFTETFEFTPKGPHLIKWRLYREQNAQCAYSQKPIDINRLFEDGYAEIDHALPYSRSFDDGMKNKVLVLTAENRNKGNQTPYEYLDGEHESQEWRTFQSWVTSNKNYREPKRRNLLRKDFGADNSHEFRERHLHDTRYIAREFKQMVEIHLDLSDVKENARCVVISGQLTGYLRARWGLVKVRENGDLHHALDAAVVAACTHSIVKRLSDYSRRGELAQVRSGYVDPETGEVLDINKLRKLDDQFPLPWPNYREELLAWLSPNPAQHLVKLPHYSEDEAKRIKPIRVSRAPTRRGMGAAHQETIRSAKQFASGKSSVRTPLTQLKLKNLPNIVGYDDPRNKSLIEAIEKRLKDHGDDGKKAFKEPLYRPSSKDKTSPIIRSVRLLDTQKSGLSVRNGIANNGDMLRIDIFEKNEKYYTVPIYVSHAVNLRLPNRAVVSSRNEDDWTIMDDTFIFRFSLYPNDWVRVTLNNNLVREGYFSGFDRSTGAIHLWTHDRNRSIGKDGLIRGIGIKTAQSVEKFHVDLLGRLHRVRNETRKSVGSAK